MKMLFPLLFMSVMVICSEPVKKKSKFEVPCNSKTVKECEEERRLFLQQYKHRGNHGEAYSHNFTLSNNQILHISSNHQIIIDHNKDANRVDIRIGEPRK